MSNAIWMLCYDIAEADRDRYLAWFHDVHVAEKLARPGYTFAAHYAGPSIAGETGSTGHVAMFGGESTRTFLDPAPSQLKVRQDELTREMMGLRRHGSGLVLTHEWTVDAAGADVPRRPVTAPAIEVLRLDAEESDEAVGIWAAQTLRTALDAGVRSFGKFSNVSAGPRHVLLLERTDEPAPGGFFAEGRSELAPHRPALAAVAQGGQRIWPA